jgi:hypothetical protein
MAIKEKIVEKLVEKIEKETGRKPILKSKEEKEVTTANKLTLGNVMPESSIMLMNEYLQEMFLDLEEQISELKNIKITKNAQASTEDYYKKIEKAQFDLKQIARICQYASNTIRANKFDKTLLDMILNNKQV